MFNEKSGENFVDQTAIPFCSIVSILSKLDQLFALKVAVHVRAIGGKGYHKEKQEG